MFGLSRKEKEQDQQMLVKGIITKAKEVLKHTPDLAKLERKQAHFVFVCDDFKRGHKRHSLLKPLSYWGQAFTSTGFCMWKMNLGRETFPIPFTSNDKLVPFSKIKGEVYTLTPEQIVFLDNHRENGIQFIRNRVRVTVPYKNMYLDNNAKVRYTSGTQQQMVTMFMYQGNDLYWSDLINGMQFGNVSLKDYGVTSTAARSASRYYEFSYQDYFDEKPIIAKRKLKPVLLDEYGNVIEEAKAIPVSKK